MIIKNAVQSFNVVNSNNLLYYYKTNKTGKFQTFVIHLTNLHETNKTLTY